jgi:hypothetical protein
LFHAIGGWRLVFVSVQIAPGAAHNVGSLARAVDGGKPKIAGPLDARTQMSLTHRFSGVERRGMDM